MMSMKNFAKVILALTVIAVFTSVAGQTACAQQRINDKIARNNGAPFFANSRASRNIQHARDYSRSIQHYTKHIPMIDPVVTKAESQVLGQQIHGIQRDMVIIREANAGNPKVVEQVKGIETKLALCDSTHEMLHKECCKDLPDGNSCCDLADKITQTLDEINADHAKLLKTMGHEDAAYGHVSTTQEHATPDSKALEKKDK